jgi:hypothetical protein
MKLEIALAVAMASQATAPVQEANEEVLPEVGESCR